MHRIGASTGSQTSLCSCQDIVPLVYNISFFLSCYFPLLSTCVFQNDSIYSTWSELNFFSPCCRLCLAPDFFFVCFVRFLEALCYLSGVRLPPGFVLHAGMWLLFWAAASSLPLSFLLLKTVVLSCTWDIFQTLPCSTIQWLWLISSGLKYQPPMGHTGAVRLRGQVCPVIPCGGVDHVLVMWQMCIWSQQGGRDLARESLRPLCKNLHGPLQPKCWDQDFK